MYTIELSQRITQRFNSGWSAMDEWRYVGQAKVLTPRHEPTDEDDGGYSESVARAVAPSSLRKVDLTKALQDTFHTSCRHEHDCCGCISTSVTAKRVSAREYVLRFFYSRNI